MPANPATLDRAAIAGRLPHRGSMCLLERVLDWDPVHIHCTAASHRDPGNPLRARGRLSSVCGIEYAAQAMAVHGSLCADADAAPPRMGLLTSVRAVTIAAPWLDDVDGELSVSAERMAGDASAVLYAFAVSGDGRVLVSGRAAVILDVDAHGGRA